MTTTPALLAHRLTPEQVNFYNQEGYLAFHKPVFTPDKFNALKNCFEAILSDLPEGVNPEAMDVPHFMFPQLYEWLFADEVMALVTPLLGEDIALFASHFICKPGGVGKRVPWHEDSAYWGDLLHPMQVVTVWLAIDPSTKANGCMQVIPRTHNHGYSEYTPVDPNQNVFRSEIVRAQRDMSKAVAIELQPNEASLHDGKIQHGSDANTSLLRRCGYTMRYISARTRFNHEKHGHRHQIFLARGHDHAGNVYGDPTRAYMELARFRLKHGKSGH